jgi:hypothetical protein
MSYGISGMIELAGLVICKSSDDKEDRFSGGFESGIFSGPDEIEIDVSHCGILLDTADVV